MDRLNFTMPQWSRHMWVNETAKQVWNPRMTKIINAVNDLSVETVAQDLRKATYFPVTPEGLMDISESLSSKGLFLVATSRAQDNKAYCTSLVEYSGKGNWYYMAVIAKQENINEAVSAIKSSDNRLMGEVLGYPQCCISFFEKKWVKEELIDLTWPMAVNTANEQGRIVELEASIECNTLLRWLGIRPVYHVPHSFKCDKSVEIGKQIMQLGKDMGYKEEMEWMAEMLSWPIEWSALHGIAEIKTPILKISTNTVPTPYKYTVKSLGTSYPAEGAIGLDFPFRPPRKKFVSDRKSYNDFFKIDDKSTVMPLPVVSNDWVFEDNDFTSLDVMRFSQYSVAEAIKEAIDKEPSRVLDLGCGNGFLLFRIMNEGKEIHPHGIDREATRIEHAHNLFPKFQENFIVGDIFDYPWLEDEYDVVVLMPGRLLEVSEEKREELKNQIKKHSKRVVLYAYGDWIKKYGSIEKLMEASGIKDEGKSWQNDYGQSALIESSSIYLEGEHHASQV